MELSDIAELSALARHIWHIHYPSIITREQIDYMLAKGYSHESLTRQIRDGHEFLLPIQNGRMMGFLSTGLLASIENPILRADGNGHFLHKFYIAPELHGRGIGKGLLRELLMRRPQIKRLRLQVARANVNAWSFYLKQGFTIEQEADFPIGENFAMKDYVMEKIIA